MANATKSAIYSPPKAGLPYLVVTVANGEVIDSTPVPTRDAARAMIAEQSSSTVQIRTDIVRH